MREIRFRTLATDNKGNSEWFYYGPQEKPIIPYKYPYIKASDVQWTGLVDRSGKEIYEGDIVRRTYAENRTALRKVVYHQDGFRLEEMDKFKGLSLLAPSLDMIEIIGNQFENPELINS